MSHNPQLAPVDGTATDVLANAFRGGPWAGGSGLDVAFTKVAIDLHNLNAYNLDAVVGAALDSLRMATGADLVLLAKLDEDGLLFNSLTMSRGESRLCDPSAWNGTRLAQLPYLASRFEHLRLTEYRNTALPGRESPGEAAFLAAAGMSSALALTFFTRQRPAGVLLLGRALIAGPWDANFQLLLKLLGSSMAVGLERSAISTRLQEVEERAALIDSASSEGLWDYDFETNRLFVSERWKEMMGYTHLGPEDAVDWRGMVQPCAGPRSYV
jgi:PAS domain-containing protein